MVKLRRPGTLGRTVILLIDHALQKREVTPWSCRINDCPKAVIDRSEPTLKKEDEMNFHESRLFRYRPVKQALNEILLSAFDQMPEEQLKEIIARQFKSFGASAPSGVKEIMQSESDTVVPVGLLDRIKAPIAYVGVTIETMIEMVIGSDAPKFSIPLSVLLTTAISSLVRCPISSPRSIIKYGTHVLVLTLLASQFLVHLIHNRLILDKGSQSADPEVVFCVVT